ncbi:MAG TPA: tetratricopeptide repeat protein, partial [Acetobacteraceae bacterium]|nr:tetratricopeptide repeat protein [Acetobacteraceae bacterium]
VLAQAACPLALWAGDLEAAERYVTMLRTHTAMHVLGVWRVYADCFEGELLLRKGESERGLGLLRGGVDELRRTGFVQYQTAFQTALARALIARGETAEARALIEEALERCRRTGEGFRLAELERTRGEIALKEEGSEAAETAFRRALDIARAQGVLMWELRAAVSLARLWRERRTPEGRESARELLASVYGRFSEGFETADMCAAASLLGELGEPVRAVSRFDI